MDVEFVPAAIGDVERLSGMMEAFYGEEGLRPAPGAAKALREVIADGGIGRCFLIRAGGEEVGYLVIAYGFSLEFGGRDAFLDELYIVPEGRKRGIGKRAIGFVLDFCRANGVQAVHLEVGRANAGAQKLYRGAGFRERHAGYDLLTHLLA